MDEKLTQLQALLAEMGSVVVAYSGGVDSSFVLKVAHDVLGARAVAVTADAPSLPRSELSIAKEIAAQIGASHICLAVSEMDDERYRANSPDRCYFCKIHTYDALTDYARDHGFRYVLDGNNADDMGDYRPGQTAAREQGVRSPLQEVGMTKTEIRNLAQRHGPAQLGQAFRRLPVIPYSLRHQYHVRSPGPDQRAESFLHQQGFRQVRVRHHGQVARLELEPADFERALQIRERIVATLKEAGYAYVTMDLSGFRSGSMNETLQRSTTSKNTTSDTTTRTDEHRATEPTA